MGRLVAEIMIIYETLEQAQEAGDAPWDKIAWKDFHVCVFEDKYPVTPGHLLFVPVYNTTDVLTDCFSDALRHGTKMVELEHWDGFNIGINYGSAAGQTINYPHIHLIPRRRGDMEDPTGGVRYVIPEQGNYRKK